MFLSLDAILTYNSNYDQLSEKTDTVADFPKFTQCKIDADDKKLIIKQTKHQNVCPNYIYNFVAIVSTFDKTILQLIMLKILSE